MEVWSCRNTRHRSLISNFFPRPTSPRPAVKGTVSVPSSAPFSTLGLVLLRAKEMAAAAAAMLARRSSTALRSAPAFGFRSMSTDPQALGKMGALAEEFAKAVKESPPEVAMEKAQALVKAFATVDGMPTAKQPTATVDAMQVMTLQAFGAKLNSFETDLIEVKVGQRLFEKYNVLFVGVLFGGIIAIPSYIFKVELRVDVIDERSKKTRKEQKEHREKCRCGATVITAEEEHEDSTPRTEEEALICLTHYISF